MVGKSEVKPLLKTSRFRRQYSNGVIPKDIG